MYSVWCDVLKVANVQPVRDQVIGDQGLGESWFTRSVGATSATTVEFEPSRWHYRLPIS